MSQPSQAIHTPNRANYIATHPPQSWSQALQLTNPVFWLSGSFLFLFVLVALIAPTWLTTNINRAFAMTTSTFGLFWQVLLLANFIIGLVLALLPTGSVRLGALKQPELANFKWLSIILCTLLAGGGVFWAAAEPIAHFGFTAPFIWR